MLWDASGQTRLTHERLPAEAADTWVHLAPAALRRFVGDHEVCWETTPRVELHDGRRVSVGYDVALFARHPRGLGLDPDSVESLELHARLGELARRVCPASLPDGVACRFSSDPARVVLRRENGFVPEAEGHIDVLHAGATFAESDAAQKECVHEIETALVRLGAQPRSWSPAARKTTPA